MPTNALENNDNSMVQPSAPEDGYCEEMSIHSYRVNRFIRRFVFSRLDRALIVTTARETISPRSPPIASSPIGEDTNGIIAHDKQYPLDPPPEPPFVLPGEAGATTTAMGFTSC